MIAAARSYPFGPIGTFLSEDPIGLAGGINPYVFAGNDPINRFDPTGLAGCTLWIYRMYVGGELKKAWTSLEGDCDLGLPTNIQFRNYGLSPSGDAGSGSGGNSPGSGSNSDAEAEQAPSCRFNTNFLRQVGQEFGLARRESRERGGWYGAPWSSPVRMTATLRDLDNITVPLHPGAAGYWHTHQNPPTTHVQRPSRPDSNWTVNVARSTNIIINQDSLYVISATGPIAACGR